VLVPDALSIDLRGLLEHFAEHGYARLGRVATDEALAAMRERSNDLMLGRVKYPGMFFQRDTETGRYDDLEFGKGYEGPTLNYRKIEKLEMDPLFLAWIENPLFERVARSLIEGDIAIYRAVLFNKAATGGTELPWHQDGGRYWGLTMEPTLQIWTALDDVPEASGCVRALPGSHKGGLASPLGGLLQEAALSAKEADSRSIPLPAAAGEAILIHNHLWHRSSVNTTGKPRRAVTTCYMSAETKCVRKKRAPRTFVRVFVDRAREQAPGG
jgi:ectoine hydroxylase-related dioxygenase (phytanoyl-CoA dioxygenase family)